ncbi:MAG: GUN4 domain-containing protein [Cyanobacteriota bacterium]|nr:GUN4 domain-containing protein [Cyanobacteriota bacterium]
MAITGAEASEVGENYTKLASLLAKKRWQRADRATAEKLLQVAGKKQLGMLEMEDIQQFPCRDLRTIDNLWLARSQGEFGLTVQRKIYDSIYNELQKRSERDVYIVSDTFNRFAEQVAWKRKDKPFLYDEDELPINSEGGEGHLPRSYIQLNAPRCCREVVLGTLCFLCASPLSSAPETMPAFLERTKSCQL